MHSLIDKLFLVVMEMLNLALSFLGSGKIRLQNEFFLLYFLEAKVFNVIL